jgi:hypothetical protein
LQVLRSQLDKAEASGTDKPPSDLAKAAARCLAELIMHYVGSQESYRPGERAPVAIKRADATAAAAEGDGAQGEDLTDEVDEALEAHVLPLLPRLAAQTEQWPLFPQKILAMVLYRCALGASPC